MDGEENVNYGLVNSSWRDGNARSLFGPLFLMMTVNLQETAFSSVGMTTQNVYFLETSGKSQAKKDEKAPVDSKNNEKKEKITTLNVYALSFKYI